MVTTYLFPGQGAQHPGMGKDLWDRFDCVKQLFRTASEVCGRDMEQLLFESDEAELKQTVNTQTAVTLMNASVREVLSQLGVHSQCSAGFSVGEMSALYDAGSISFEEVMHLVQTRASLMVQNSRSYEGVSGGPGMAAVIGLTFSEVQELINHAGIDNVFAANHNGPRQVAISGLTDSISALKPFLVEGGARRVIPLKVSGFFHTPLLAEAAEAFALELQKIHWKPFEKSCYSNATGELIPRAEDAALLCSRQITSPVRWVDIMERIRDGGADVLMEVGPGKVLTGLWGSVSKEISCRPVGTLDQIEELAGSIMSSV